MSNCTCTPGSEENNWFEERCAKCLKAESDQWAAMMARLRLDIGHPLSKNRDNAGKTTE